PNPLNGLPPLAVARLSKQSNCRAPCKPGQRLPPFRFLLPPPSNLSRRTSNHRPHHLATRRAKVPFPARIGYALLYASHAYVHGASRLPAHGAVFAGAGCRV